MKTSSVEKIYDLRFGGLEEYRNQVWQVLVRNFFSRWFQPESKVLDLGCGYGEFINNVEAKNRFAMDLNPKARDHLGEGIEFIQQDCSQSWPVETETLDTVFTSNFFEHLPDKKALERTIEHIHEHLKPGGRLLMLGPNIEVLKGAYWNFWDHHIPLSHESAAELLELKGFTIEKNIRTFLPYNMTRVRKRPLFLVSMYLRLRWAWPLFGKQFFLVARKPRSET
jgi:SAM-dependent methyltransferase